MKMLVALGFIAILGSLAAALVFMLKGNQGDEKARTRSMARSLTFRIGLSVALFLCILLAWKLGLIQPTGRLDY